MSGVIYSVKLRWHLISDKIQRLLRDARDGSMQNQPEDFPDFTRLSSISVMQ